MEYDVLQCEWPTIKPRMADATFQTGGVAVLTNNGEFSSSNLFFNLVIISYCPSFCLKTTPILYSRISIFIFLLNLWPNSSLFIVTPKKREFTSKFQKKEPFIIKNHVKTMNWSGIELVSFNDKKSMEIRKKK